MRKKSSITLGPGASSLILIFVVLSLMTLGMLSLMTGRNDLTLSKRSAEVVEAVYTLNTEAEERRGILDAILAKCQREATDDAEYLALIEANLEETGEEYILEDGMISFFLSDGFRELDCALLVHPMGDTVRSSWARYNLTAVTEDVWN